MANLINLLPVIPIRASLVLTSSLVAATIFDVKHQEISFVLDFSYTRGAAGGFPEIALEWSAAVDGSWSSEIVQDPVVVVTQPTAALSSLLARIVGPQPATDSLIRFLSPEIRRPRGKRYFRASAREGSGLTVGTLAIDLCPEMATVGARQ